MSLVLFQYRLERALAPKPIRDWLSGGIFLLLCLSGVARAASGLPEAGKTPETPAEIAIIIDDMGRQLTAGRRVIALPGPVACAFLPHGPYTDALARTAHVRDKEILLHLPMQAMDSRRLDAGGLRLDMTQRAFLSTLQDNLGRVPHVQGVNNHMGSLLTRHPGHMLWLMQALRDQGGLFFVDSRTSRHTIARRIAREQAVPSIERDVFLDDDVSVEAVREQFARLLRLARQQGSAVAIGHPHASTLQVLEAQLPRLSEQGVRLVPVSRLVQQQYVRDSQWRLSLSPLPRAAKNSRPSP